MNRYSFLCALFLVASSTLVAQMGPPPPRVFGNVGIDQNLNGQIPLDLPFRDETGRQVTLAQYFTTRPVVISLVYYRCPMLCTQVLNGMVETFRTMDMTAGKEFEVVTISIDPAEGPDLAEAKKAEYVEAYGRSGVAHGWHFLTGDQEAITKVANAVGFRYVYDEQTKQFAHASGIMVATPKGILARYLYGIEYSAKDLKFSLMEAAEQRIGSAVDKLLLLCYHYDPATGKYGAVVTNILRGGGILTILLLGGYMGVNFLRDKRRNRVAAHHGAGN